MKQNPAACSCDVRCPAHNVSVTSLLETPELEEDDVDSVNTSPYVSSNEGCYPTRVSSPLDEKPARKTPLEAGGGKSPAPAARTGTRSTTLKAGQTTYLPAAQYTVKNTPATDNPVATPTTAAAKVIVTDHGKPILAPNEITVDGPLPDALLKYTSHVYIVTHGRDPKIAETICGVFADPLTADRYSRNVRKGSGSFRCADINDAAKRWRAFWLSGSIDCPVHPQSIIGRVVTDEEIALRIQAAEAAQAGQSDTVAAVASSSGGHEEHSADVGKDDPPPLMDAEQVELRWAQQAPIPMYYCVIKGNRPGKYYTEQAYRLALGNHPDAQGRMFENITDRNAYISERMLDTEKLGPRSA